ncbi:MAG: type II toxin-antitoxin system VapC family toxin [Actinomycetota bacterium]
MIVLDASALVDLLLRTEGVGPLVEERVGSPGESLHCPHIVDAEALSAIRRKRLRGFLSDERAGEAVADLRSLRLERYSLWPFLEGVWSFRENLTPFDAAYLVLAEALGCPVVTTDPKLKSPSGMNVPIELIE